MLVLRSVIFKYNDPHKLHTFKENMTIIDFSPRPGPKVPYVFTGSICVSCFSCLNNNSMNWVAYEKQPSVSQVLTTYTLDLMWRKMDM